MRDALGIEGEQDEETSPNKKRKLDDNEPEQQQQQSLAEDEDDVRYEPITEAFIFENEIIHPCYCVLPFVADEEVETLCKRPITDFFEDEVDGQQAMEAEDDVEEAPLTIDEDADEEMDEEESVPAPKDLQSSIEAMINREAAEKGITRLEAIQ